MCIQQVIECFFEPGAAGKEEEYLVLPDESARQYQIMEQEEIVIFPLTNRFDCRKALETGLFSSPLHCL
jgi:hypothetical protein